MKMILLLLATLSTTTFANYEMSYSEHEKFQQINFSTSKTLQFQVKHPKLDAVLKQIHGNKDIVFNVGNFAGGNNVTLHWILKRIKRKCAKERGSRCHITSVFVGLWCYSACTFIPLLTDRAVVANDKVKFGFHRPYFRSSKYPLLTKKGLARLYVLYGGNSDWFYRHADSLSRKDNNDVAKFDFDDLRGSGMLDEKYSSFQEFADNYYSSF